MELRNPDNDVSKAIRWMAAGPRREALSYHGYHVNGVDFNTKDRDSMRSVQNSGVFLVVDALQVASVRDKNPRDNAPPMDFYGVVKLIWEVDYYTFRIPVFKCDWVESTRGVRVDELGFTLVKLNRLGHFNDPFVLATHVKQVFYIEDPSDVEWSVVVKCPDADYEGADDDDEMADIDIEQGPFNPTMPSVETFDDVLSHEPKNHLREGDEEIEVDI